MQKAVIMGLHKEIRPPMAVPSKFKGVLSLIPDAVNYVDVQNSDKIGPLYQVQLNLQNLLVYIESLHDSISKDYYNDLFLMIAAADKSLTATEVVERHEEKLFLFGPTIERHEQELLNPLNVRVFNICLRAGLIPEPPEQIEGAQIKVEYVSLLAQAQKLVTTQSLNAHVTMLERVGQFDPDSVMATTDFIELINSHSDVVGVPPKITRTKEEAEEFLNGIKEAREEQAQAEQAMELVKAAPKDSSEQLSI